jgi:hypothetical protein
MWGTGLQYLFDLLVKILLLAASRVRDYYTVVYYLETDGPQWLFKHSTDVGFDEDDLDPPPSDSFLEVNNQFGKVH